jgi:hypothetical protein
MGWHLRVCSADVTSRPDTEVPLIKVGKHRIEFGRKDAFVTQPSKRLMETTESGEEVNELQACHFLPIQRESELPSRMLVEQIFHSDANDILEAQRGAMAVGHLLKSVVIALI